MEMSETADSMINYLKRVFFEIEVVLSKEKIRN